MICELAAADRRVRGLRLSRHFGQHAAITAGLAECKGRRAVVMDCDLQDPPEVIPQLWEKALAGHDIVLARRKRKRQTVFRRIAAALYFRTLGALSKQRFDGEFGAFSIVSRQVIDAYLRFQDRERHYLFILYWLGFDATAVEYEHASRHSGTSSYSLRALLRHAVNGIVFQTTTVLRWIVYFGFTVSTGGRLSRGLPDLPVPHAHTAARVDQPSGAHPAGRWIRRHERRHHRPLHRQDLRASEGPPALCHRQARQPRKKRMSYAYVAATVLLTVYRQLVIQGMWRTQRAAPMPPTARRFPGAARQSLGAERASAAFAAALCWMLAMVKLDLSHAYPFVSLSFVLVLFLSALLFGEPLSWAKVAGVALIVCGVALGSQG